MIQEQLRIATTNVFTAALCPWPILPGHALIVPKAPNVYRTADLTAEDSFQLWKGIDRIAQLLKGHYGCDATNVSMLDGGRKFDSLVVHVIPRKAGDLEDNDWIYPQIDSFEERLSAPIQDMQTLSE